MKIVKNSISHILAFILMIILTFFIIFIIFENNLSLNKINKNMNNLNYYELAYKNILEKINDFIILEDVQKLYNNYLTIDLVKEDVKEITKSIYEDREYKITRYDDFYKIIYEYSEDEEVSEKYASEINKIYQENLFPIKPFKIINKLYLKDNIQFLIVTSLVIITFLIGYFLYIINKNLKYQTISILGMSILIILPNIFIRLLKVFDGFLYTNEYFTKIILTIINNTFNMMNIIGVIIILMIGINYKRVVKLYH